MVIGVDDASILVGKTLCDTLGKQLIIDSRRLETLRVLGKWPFY